jgi:ABC-type branched-subunit amino acid transport system substrate-binding protein
MERTPRIRARQWGRLLGASLACTLVLAACGGGDKKSDGGGSKAANGCTATAANTSGAVTNNAGKTPANVAGFDGQTIKLGAITPVTTLASILGKSLTAGNQVYWDAVNAKGGIAGKYKVQLVIEDSQYTPTGATQAYEKTKNSVVAYNQVFGTQITNTLLPSMTKDNISGSPATLDAAWVCQTNMLPLGGPYQVQAINGLDWYIQKNGKAKRICSLSQDDTYGDAALQGLDYAAKKFGFAVVTKQKFAQGAPDVTPQVQALKDNKCDATLLAALPTDTNAIATKAQTIGLETQLIGLSPSWLGLFAGNKYLQTNYVVSSEGPAWGDTSVPGMAQMLADHKQFAPNEGPSNYFAYGYAQSWAMAQVLEKAVANGDLSRGGIQKAMTQVDTLKFGNLVGDYVYGKGVADRNPPRTSSIFSVDSSSPGGLKMDKFNITSDTAKEFTIAG